jgi:hypothetical protein
VGPDSWSVERWLLKGDVATLAHLATKLERRVGKSEAVEVAKRYARNRATSCAYCERPALYRSYLKNGTNVHVCKSHRDHAVAGMQALDRSYGVD